MTNIPAPVARMIATSQLPITLAERRGEDTPLVSVNAAFERLTGYDRSDLIGRDCRLLQGARTQPAARTALRTALDANVEGQAVITNYRRNGEEFDSFVFVFPMIRDGSATLFLGSQFEIPREDRMQAFELHGGFLIGALSDLARELPDDMAIAHDALQRLDRGALVRRRMENWAQAATG